METSSKQCLMGNSVALQDQFLGMYFPPSAAAFSSRIMTHIYVVSSYYQSVSWEFF